MALSEDGNPLDALIEEELLMARVCKVFAARLPHHGAFWEKISRQGSEHAAWLKELRSRFDNGQVNLDVGKVRLQTILTLSAYLKGIIADQTSIRIELRELADIIREQERQLIQEEVLSHLECPDRGEDSQDILVILRHPPGEHVDKLLGIDDGSSCH